MKLKKKKLLVERGDPFLIRQAPNEKHNEVTVAVLKYYLPIYNFTGYCTKPMLDMINKVSVVFPEANIQFSFKDCGAPSFSFTCRGKTERRGDDVHNQELADRIAIAKCRARACAISIRIIKAIRKVIAKDIDHMDNVICLFQEHHAREMSFIQKM